MRRRALSLRSVLFESGINDSFIGFLFGDRVGSVRNTESYRCAPEACGSGGGFYVTVTANYLV